MKKLWKRGLAALCAMVLLLGLLPMGALAAEEHTIWLVGDSTVCDYAASDDATLFYKRCGYGTALKDYVDGTYAVVNLAVSGQSSKSFPSQQSAKYTQLTSGIKAGDVLIIGFGHNDEKSDDAARYTAPNGTSTTEGSFAKSLADNYIKVAKDAGATPILCTPIVRRTESASWSGDKLHQANGGDYAEDIRKLGAELNVAVVDMTTLTKEKYDEVGTAESANFHSWGANKKVDNTHLNAYGAHVVAQILAGEIAKLTDLDVASHVDPSKVAPDKATHLVQNPDWVDPATLPYTPPDTVSDQCEPYVVDGVTFYGTAIGDLAGAPSAANHIRETTQDGDMHIAVKNSKGKISSGADGIVMYYYQVPSNKPFTLKAKATVNAVDTTNTQGAFGLMARDDMYIDEGASGSTLLTADYVTAGCLSNGAGVNFARRGGSLNKNGSLSLANALEAGKSYELSIIRSVDGNYACSIDGVAATYDYSIDFIDAAYTYIGMFCARNTDVTYSDILLIVDGEVLCGSQGGDTPDDPTPDDPTPDEPVVVDGAVAGGGLETIFAEIAGISDADVTAVKYTGPTTGELAGADLEYLVRDVDGGVRIDIPGVKAGTYTLKVTIKGEEYTAKSVEVKAQDRSGFAHQTVDANSACTPYTEGVGAYKDDGTLKENATVLYVTEENKETVTLTQGFTVTGIGNILNCKGWDQNQKAAGNKDDVKLLLKMADANRPLVIRIVGEVTKPEGTTTAWSTANGGSTDDGGGMCMMEYGGNITIEGIGPDATVNGWGFNFSADGTGRTALGNKRANAGQNFEVRNLTFKNVPEDCVGISGSQKGDTFQDAAEHVWVHNNSFYGPTGLPDQSADKDKSEGDGAVDMSNGEYVTMSYNYFEGYHKTSLIGGGDPDLQYHVTWHHNWWKNVQSRSPLARQADMHIYNNLFDGQTKYCMSLRANTYIYSEYNTFLNCKSPVVDEGTGGVCKSYQDVFTDCTGTNNATIVTDKAQTVTSANPFANFDTQADSYVAKGAYKLDADDRGQANIAAWNGVLKTADKMTTVPMTVGGEDDTVAVTGVSLNKTAASVKVGKTLTLTATVTPTDATDPGVTWTTSDAEVATVDENGVVTGVTAGTATITVTTADGGKTATCLVTVTAASSNAGTGTSRPSSSTVTTPVTEPDDTKPDATPADPVAETYGDVEPDSWYTSGVQFVVDKKLFIGVSDHSFAPNVSMSRAMVMTVLARVDGKEPTAKAGEPWYSEAMAWAVTAGVSDGTNPNGDVTLEQFATMLYRYAVDKKLAEAVEADLTGVPDADQVSDWAAQAITWAKAQGILQGDQAGKLNPQNNASRAQAAVIMERFVEKCVK